MKNWAVCNCIIRDVDTDGFTVKGVEICAYRYILCPTCQQAGELLYERFGDPDDNDDPNLPGLDFIRARTTEMDLTAVKALLDKQVEGLQRLGLEE